MLQSWYLEDLIRKRTLQTAVKKSQGGQLVKLANESGTTVNRSLPDSQRTKREWSCQKNLSKGSDKKQPTKLNFVRLGKYDDIM